MHHTSEPVRVAASGLAGAVGLTLAHEIGRHVLPHAPRMDLVGQRLLRRGLRAGHAKIPSPRAQYGLSLFGDLMANGLTYALVAGGRRPWLRGALIGTASGLAALVAPQAIGLGSRAQARSVPTALMTVGWYALGGLAAAAVAQALAPRRYPILGRLAL